MHYMTQLIEYYHLYISPAFSLESNVKKSHFINTL